MRIQRCIHGSLCTPLVRTRPDWNGRLVEKNSKKETRIVAHSRMNKRVAGGGVQPYYALLRLHLLAKTIAPVSLGTHRMTWQEPRVAHALRAREPFLSSYELLPPTA